MVGRIVGWHITPAIIVQRKHVARQCVRQHTRAHITHHTHQDDYRVHHIITLITHTHTHTPLPPTSQAGSTMSRRGSVHTFDMCEEALLHVKCVCVFVRTFLTSRARRCAGPVKRIG